MAVAGGRAGFVAGVVKVMAENSVTVARAEIQMAKIGMAEIGKPEIGMAKIEMAKIAVNDDAGANER